MKTNPLYSFALPRSVLKALALFQSTDTSRYILNSTKFEISLTPAGDHRLQLIATNGRILGLYTTLIEIDKVLGELPAEAEFSIDLKGLGKLPAKASGQWGPRYVTLAIYDTYADLIAGEYVYQAKFVTGADGMKDDRGLPLGRFPSWRGILPAESHGQIEHFAVHPDFVFQLVKVSSLLSKSNSGLVLRGHKGGDYYSVQVVGCPEFFGVLMPIKGGSVESHKSLAEIKSLAAPLASQAKLQPATA